MDEILSKVVYGELAHPRVITDQAACWVNSSPSRKITPVRTFDISSDPFSRRQCC